MGDNAFAKLRNTTSASLCHEKDHLSIGDIYVTVWRNHTPMIIRYVRTLLIWAEGLENPKHSAFLLYLF